MKKLIIIGKGRVAKQCFSIAKEFLKPKFSELIDYELSTKELDAKFNALKNHLIISANNFYLFKAPCVKNNTIINYHNALLPRHRGVNAHIWAIFKGDKKSGISWHFVDECIDTGRILTQKEIPLNDKITAHELLSMQHKLAINSLKESLEKLKLGFKGFLGTGGGDYHFKKDLPNKALLNLAWDESKISRFLRSMNLGIFDTIRPKIKLFGEEVELSSYEFIKDELRLNLSNNLNLIIKKEKK